MTFQKDPAQHETKFLNQSTDFTRKRVLEIGIGEGRLTWQYAGLPALTVGIDPDPDSLRVATIDRPSNLEDKVFLANALAENLPFAREKFDIALRAWSF